MVTAVKGVLSKLFAKLWRTVEEDEEDTPSAMEEIRHLRGSKVTQLCLDYGMIDGAVYFTGADVVGGVPLRLGDVVNGIAVRDGVQGGWRALRVEKNADAWEEGGGPSLETDSNRLRPLIGTVTSCDTDGGFINQTTFFPHHALCDGYEPMKGDWVQASYLISPTDWTTQARSVAPLRYRRLDQVCVSSVCGRHGVVEDSVFFSLDSLLRPAHYLPAPGDVVSLVVVESSQSFYCWRALCMAPSPSSLNAALERLLPEAVLQSLLEDKGGMEVTDYGDFGPLLLGETCELVFWIQNKGSETHRLKCCEFAGWDSEEQFTLGPIKGPTPRDKNNVPCGGASVPSAKGTPSLPTPADGQTGDTEGSATPQEKSQQASARRVEKHVDIAPGKRLSVLVCCTAKNLGRSVELLLLHFHSFTIGRRLGVMVTSKEESLLQPCTPYLPYQAPAATLQPAPAITVSAPPVPRRLLKRNLPSFLGHYPVPQTLRSCVEMQSDVLVSEHCLGQVLSGCNVRARFSALLWLEELHAERELKEFSITGAILRRGAVYLHLEVLGLADGRPNLFLGDRVALRKPQSDGTVVEYIGYVAEIHDEDVSLRVNSEFQNRYLGEPLDVEFTYNRVTMRRCHRALEQYRHFGPILFPINLARQAPQWTGEWTEDPDKEKKTPEDNEVPTMENGKKPSSVSIDMKSRGTQTKDCRPPIPGPGCFFNPQLNPPQREAVKRILAGECRPMPYILFGPPGTGKTITFIEAILQVYHRLSSSRVLVCTPSNSAADLICTRLHHSGFLHAASLARVNASCRQEESIPEVVRQYSQAGEDIRHASFHRVVVSTCSSAGMFYQIGLKLGHFTHVFVDEAGQATEPEALIPIGLLSERDGQIVLAGDPCQLGPVVKSKLAATFGLGVSLMERLMANPLYCREDWGYNPKLVTKLIFNYRSHEALLTLPSRLFYQGELFVKAPKAVVEALCAWKGLPHKGFPLLFHGIRGSEMREGHNPSWFNPGEAVQVMLYCCQLAKKLYKPVAACDIGIIAPYRKQSEKIRSLLDRVGLSDIKVGSVEEFQGQEFLVIILSTVRSNESASEDLQNVLGFLSNPKRFNVAITRPKALLIIVGNPHVLIKDPCFSALLQYSFDNGAFMGCDPPPSLRASTRAADEQQKP